jgi:hypothetical protein
VGEAPPERQRQQTTLNEHLDRSAAIAATSRTGPITFQTDDRSVAEIAAEILGFTGWLPAGPKAQVVGNFTRQNAQTPDQLTDFTTKVICVCLRPLGLVRRLYTLAPRSAPLLGLVMLGQFAGVTVCRYDIRRPLTPTGTSLLGLVKHLTGCEIGYFGYVFGRPFPDLPRWLTYEVEPNADMWPTADEAWLPLPSRMGGGQRRLTIRSRAGASGWRHAP